MSKLLVWVCVCLGVAGCGGGGGGGGAGIDPRLARLDMYEAQKLRVLGDATIGVGAMPATADADIPASGTALFAGSATLRVEAGANSLVLFGDADITLDFTQNTTQGSLGNFFGQSANQQVSDYDGTVTLVGSAAAADFAMTYAGTLSATGQVLTLAGSMDAQLLGAGMAAIAASDLEARVDQNAVGRDATLVVIAERFTPDPPVTLP